MTGYDTNEGYRVEPLDDRDAEDPEYEIDPMYSGTHDDGGEHRRLRHKEVEPVVKTPAERAVFDPTEPRSPEQFVKEEMA